jgi:parallel beta-helix repeat protein
VRRLATIAATLLACCLAGAPAGAATRSGTAVIEVFPGPQAIGQALAQANAGDTLNIHAGTYQEHVTVNLDDVTLQAAGDGQVIIDGTCNGDTLTVRSDGVTLQELTVVGAGGSFAPIEINFVGAASGRVLKSSVQDTCGNAEYGINVFNSGSIRIINNKATGFEDAGIYIGQITSTELGPLLVSGNESFGNVRGIIVENSAGGHIVLRVNVVHDNTTNGIWITNSDHVRAVLNTVMDNGQSGIDLDPLSDHNVIRSNTALGHTWDLENEGGNANCFLDNFYGTSRGDISC